jgi:hypothetical protein
MPPGLPRPLAPCDSSMMFFRIPSRCARRASISRSNASLSGSRCARSRVCLCSRARRLAISRSSRPRNSLSRAMTRPAPLAFRSVVGTSDNNVSTCGRSALSLVFRQRTSVLNGSAASSQMALRHRVFSAAVPKASSRVRRRPPRQTKGCRASSTIRALPMPRQCPVVSSLTARGFPAPPWTPRTRR